MIRRRTSRGFVDLGFIATTMLVVGLVLPTVAVHRERPVGPLASCVARRAPGCPRVVPSPPPVPVVPIAEVERMLRGAARDTGVHLPLLRAVARRESAMRSDAVSSAGAVGVLQTLPETARENGCAHVEFVRCEVYAGSRYLARLLVRFHGDRRLAVAAYNAGPGAVDKYHGVPPYAETQAYVAAIFAEVGS